MLNKLVIFILTVSNIWLVHGDEALVKEVCGKTPRPEVCVRCLKDAGAGTDKKGLALRSIACVMRTSNIVNGDLENVSRGSNDPAIKDKCARCQQMIGVDAVQSLRNAESLLKDGSMAAAKTQLSAANDRLLDSSKLVPELFDDRLSQDFSWLWDLLIDTFWIMSQL